MLFIAIWSPEHRGTPIKYTIRVFVYACTFGKTNPRPLMALTELALCTYCCPLEKLKTTSFCKTQPVQCEGNVTRDARSSGCTVSTQMTDLRQPTLKAQEKYAMGQMVEGRGLWGRSGKAPGGHKTDLWAVFC